jgi:DNA-binding beta-propeller fold protein YncE
MRARLFGVLVVVGLLVAVLPAAAQRGTPAPAQAEDPAITLSLLGRYAPASRAFDAGAAEIVAHDPATQQLFVVNGQTQSIDILSITTPTTPTLVSSIAINPTYGADAQSVAVHNGVVAVAIQPAVKTDPGSVAFFDTAGEPLGQVTVGALPDMLTFTPDGTRVLVANEGEPNDLYTIDPEGSVSIIDLTNGVAEATVTTVGFTDFNAGGPRAGDLPAAVRIFGPNASVAQDLEPEYIAISADGGTAYVTLQENNALAIIDIAAAEVTAIAALGFKDHSLAANALDASDRDGPGNTALINIAPQPIFGMYQPDAVATYVYSGTTFLVTANEGDARVYPTVDIPEGPEEGDIFNEESRVSSLTLNTTIFTTTAAFARLNVTNTLGDTGGNGTFDELYAFGARSFSIWDGTTGALVYDSGDQLERITAAAFPEFFNASNTDNNLDSRSDNKGPEPEGVALGAINSRTYAFIGLERIGGVMVYDVTEPTAPSFVQYINTRDFTRSLDPELDPPEWQDAGDLGPEGLIFVPANASPTRTPLLIVAYEISGTVAIFEIAADTLLHLPVIGGAPAAE